MDEVEDLRQRLSKIQNDFNISMSENERLADELTRQQALYTELKKMRGRGEEMDMLQQLEQVSQISRKSSSRSRVKAMRILLLFK